MTTTITKTFDKTDLPQWAQKHPEVVWVCKNDLGFRCDVHRADTPAMKRHLIRVAEQRYHG
jgi:hypothetical protein